MLSLGSTGCLGNEFIFCKFVAWAYVCSFVSRTNFNYSKLDHGQNKYRAYHLSCPTCIQIRNRSDPSSGYQQTTLFVSVAELNPISTSPRLPSQPAMHVLVHESQSSRALQLLKPSPNPRQACGAVRGCQKSTQQLSLDKYAPSACPVPAWSLHSRRS